MPETHVPVISLTTDFGTTDYFVGAIKGVITSITPEAPIIDITHDIPPYDFIGAAFTIKATYAFFPNWSIHVVVIDPTVGSSRRPILVVGDHHYFIGPDNGIFSLIYESQEFLRVYHLTGDHLFRTPVCPTFHARDIFAPVAAWLARGIEPSQMGELIEDYMKIPLPKPVNPEANVYKGVVLYIDRFGNLITNFDQAYLENVLGEDLSKPCILSLNQKNITGVKQSYHQVSKGKLIALIGGSGYLEIAANQGNAAEILHVSRGNDVRIMVMP